ncbi:type II toxin-antitoxin system RatA family toxin [Haliea sp. E1-2-M8]|uniref:type II toxin-antitoxin system RatA family toxin n=1 Tax=Haliea sp. E1-2-M8 TaxID=3064706 RepID=UPI002719700C|nr:type II toxin-antitoxin system RatA family toxin [Haliea sp. E1-2-M8]MDO8862599.1 type II toxin-antitoxin system RatA family toxin [Haliea sp. E1-2-M8]
MTIIHRHALLPYRDRLLFDLVNDIEAYPQYMEGCTGAEVLRREEDLVDARLRLSRGGISQSFSTRNRLQAPEIITLELLDGPFDYFQGRWEFRGLAENACKVSLHLEFTISNLLVGAAVGRLFDRVTNNLVDALGRRARQLYG